MYGCKDCGRRFNNKRRQKPKLIKKLWFLYVFGKQTLRELSNTYKKDIRTIKALFATITLPPKKHNPRPIHMTVDATYFGKRKEGKSWCVVIVRDPYSKENIWWKFVNRETTSVYVEMRKDLEFLGYTILSVTGDGFGGIKQAFYGIPYQMCHVHMERIVKRQITDNPKLEANRVLRAIIKTLGKTDRYTFVSRLNEFIALYKDFLAERTINLETGKKVFTHRATRSALKSIKHFLPHLFTYENDIQIPRTTNSPEGHFRHIKRIVNVHCGLSRSQKEKVLETILLVGTTAPSDKDLRELF